MGARSGWAARCQRRWSAPLKRTRRASDLSRIATPASHDRVMTNAMPDLAVLREALLDHGLDAAGLAQWTRDLVVATTMTAGLQAEVQVGTPPVEWSVEARTAGRPVVLVDVGTDALGEASVDQLELRASHVWRDVTRSAAVFEPRPWIGAVRVTEEAAIDAVSVQRIRHLVASRTLDAACVVVVDRRARAVRSPTSTLSIESFAAALTGRCLVLVAGNSAVAR